MLFVAAAEFDPAVHFSTPAELVDRPYNRLTTDQLQRTRVVGPLTDETLAVGSTSD